MQSLPVTCLIRHLAELDGLRAETEFQFASPRKWRFDAAIPELRLAIEIEGGGWTGGRHTRGKGFEADLEKYAEAFARGWTVFRVSPAMALNGQAKEYVRRWLAARKEQW